jgi:DNA-binding response OmpR family regulator
MEEEIMGGVQRSLATRRLDLDETPRSSVEPIFDPNARLQPVVMVIDDSLAVRRVVEISLNRQGISTISFGDGVDAITTLSLGEIAPPKVLLVDIGLPRMNGYDVARRLKSNQSFRDCKVYMLTGHDGLMNRAYARLLGAGFIAKPFRAPELVEIVCEALGMRPPDNRWR